MGAKAVAQTRSWFVLDRRDWFAMDRADYLLAKILLGIAVVGSVLFGLAGPAFDAATNAPLLVSYPTKIPSGVELPRGAIRSSATATVEVLLKDATLGERLSQAIPGLLMAAMTIAIAWLLFRLLRSVQAAEPFTRRNIRHITAIALVVGIGGMLTQLAQGLAGASVQTSDRLPNPQYLIFVMTLNPLPLVVMLAIALVGEAFRRGVVLRHDVEGLV